MKFHVFISEFTLDELEKEVSKTKSQGFETVGSVKENILTRPDGKEVGFYEQEMRRDVYEGYNTFGSFNKWKEENQ